MTTAHWPKPLLSLLGATTVLFIAGPFTIAAVLRGGSNRRWPPDRPVEWWTSGIVVGLFVALLAVQLAIGVRSWLRLRAQPPSPSRSTDPCS